MPDIYIDKKNNIMSDCKFGDISSLMEDNSIDTGNLSNLMDDLNVIY